MIPSFFFCNYTKMLWPKYVRNLPINTADEMLYHTTFTSLLCTIINNYAWHMLKSFSKQFQYFYCQKITQIFEFYLSVKLRNFKQIWTIVMRIVAAWKYGIKVKLTQTKEHIKKKRYIKLHAGHIINDNFKRM